MSRSEPAGEGEALETRPGASPGLRGPLAAAVLALAVHGLFLSALPAGLRGNDSADYESFYRPVARSWLAGDGLVSPDGDPAVRYPPGFPALLALTFAVGDSLGFGEPAATRLMNALFVALGAAAFTMLARSFCRRRWAARLATGLWITYPPLLWLGKQPSSEMPFFFFVFLSAWSGRKAFLRVERPESRYSSPLRATLPRPALAWAALAGASAGVATLLRPAALLLALPALAAVILARARIRRRAAVLAVGLLCQAAILLPWEAWMWRQTGKLMPVSSGGRLSLLDGLTISIKPGRLGRPDLGPGTVELQQDLQAHRRQIDGPLDAAAFLGRKAREEPGPVLRLLAAKAARSWYATDSLRFERWILLLQIPYLLLAAAGTWLWVRQRAADRERVADLVTVAVFVVYFWGMTFLVLSILRYMLPAMALLMLPAGEALRRALLTSGQLLAPRLESNGGLEVPP